MIANAVILLLASAAQQPAAPSQADPNERVCKVQTQTGTRFPKKRCHTRAEWDRLMEASRRQAAEEFNKPTINIQKGN